MTRRLFFGCNTHIRKRLDEFGQKHLDLVYPFR